MNMIKNMKYTITGITPINEKKTSHLIESVIILCVIVYIGILLVIKIYRINDETQEEEIYEIDETSEDEEEKEKAAQGKILKKKITANNQDLFLRPHMIALTIFCGIYIIFINILNEKNQKPEGLDIFQSDSVPGLIKNIIEGFTYNGFARYIMLTSPSVYFLFSYLVIYTVQLLTEKQPILPFILDYFLWNILYIAVVIIIYFLSTKAKRRLFNTLSGQHSIRHKVVKYLLKILFKLIEFFIIFITVLNIIYIYTIISSEILLQIIFVIGLYVLFVLLIKFKQNGPIITFILTSILASVLTIVYKIRNDILVDLTGSNVMHIYIYTLFVWLLFIGLLGFTLLVYFNNKENDNKRYLEHKDNTYVNNIQDKYINMAIAISTVLPDINKLIEYVGTSTTKVTKIILENIILKRRPK